MSLPIVGHVSTFAVVGLACGPIAVLLFFLAICESASDADDAYERALSERYHKLDDESWLNDTEPAFDFQLATARHRGAVNCEQAGDRQWL